MPVTITTRGWIELYRDGALVSRHNVESEAIERAVEHAEANGDGDYELRYPNKAVRVSLLQKTVIPFSWRSIAVEFRGGEAFSVDLGAFLDNPYGHPVTYAALGTLPTGVTLTGSSLAYNGQGPVDSRQVTFTAVWGNLVATSGQASVAIIDVNVAPAFTVAPASSSLPATGGTIQFTAVDPDGDPVTYRLTSTRNGITINASTGLVTVAATAAGTTGAIQVEASDGALVTLASCQVTVAAVASTQKKWHPGHGIKVDPDNGTLSSLTGARSTMVRVQDGPQLTFIWANIRWGRLNPTGTTYDWTELDAHLARAAELGSRLHIEIAFKTFSTTNAFIMPADLLAAGGAPTNVNGDYVAALWRQPIMDRFIAFFQAMSARYDNDPRLEGLTWSETATGGANIPDFSTSGYADQLVRLYNAVGAAFQSTFAYAYINTLDGQVSRLVATAFAAGLGFGCPDARDKQGNMTFRGAASDGGYPLIDYRNRMAFASIVSVSSFPSAPTIVDWLQNQQATHAGWITYAADTETWSDYLAAMAADPDWHTAYPTGI